MTRYSHRAGRLYRVLNADPSQSVFEFDMGQATMRDDDVCNVSMKRGNAGASSGLTPATAEAVIPYGWYPADPDSTFQFRLSSYGLSLLNLPSSCQVRWTGRISAQTVNDISDTRRETTIQAASWSQQVPLTTKPQTIVAGSADNHIGAMLQRAWSGTQVPYTLKVSGDTDTFLFPYGAKTLVIPAEEVWSKWAKDLGMLIRTLRSGNAEALGLYSRVVAADRWAATTPTPLMRRFCESPAEWSQPVTNPAAVEWTYHEWTKADTKDEDKATVTITVGWGTLNRPLPVIQLDTSHAYRATDNQERLANAMANAATALGYRVQSVTVDLLNLIHDGSDFAHALLVQLLELEEGDPVALSYDWPSDVSGVYYVSEVNETVTPNSWSMTLCVDPTKHITGRESPEPAYATWDTKYPNGTTWDYSAATKSPTWDQT